MKKVLTTILCLLLLITLLGQCSGKSNGFSMSSDDTVGAVKRYIVSGESGTYTITCTGGHGWLLINDKDGFAMANDSYLGKEYTGTTYVKSVTVELKEGDLVKARNFNSSKFKLSAQLEK